MNIKLNTYERNKGPLTINQLDENWLNIEEMLNNLENTSNRAELIHHIQSKDWTYKLKSGFIEISQGAAIKAKILLDQIYDRNSILNLHFIENKDEFNESKYNNNDIILIPSGQHLYYSDSSKQWAYAAFMAYSNDDDDKKQSK
ncbi:hypothetical protein [Candidatus Cytomitobacter primus]|uniref:Uncharacterized protein n=1 Tax=Candidatus Cytomitobacter primus TaxID=2066024 RepID=A0A5C0UFN0_9PROT|nr:hypothetical protein [Candidatus Cytomitobacter primus]QEK38527.1 hypothetical protein FZC34_01220 [Candidatus Cytomitobacter primus]